MRIALVDDDAIVAASLSTILSLQADIDVCGVGASGEDAIALFEQHAPDVLLMDIQMPGMGGLDAAERILAAHPDARIVFLTTFADDDYIVRALKLGARGYLIKQDVARIAPALRAVMAGSRVLEGEVLERAAFGIGRDRTAAKPGASSGAAASGSARGEGEAALAGLTERERDVVYAVADGLDNAQIADELCLSEGTVRNHINAVLAKLGLRNRTQIAVYYYRNCT